MEYCLATVSTFRQKQLAHALNTNNESSASSAIASALCDVLSNNLPMNDFPGPVHGDTGSVGSEVIKSESDLLRTSLQGLGRVALGQQGLRRLCDRKSATTH